MTRILLALLLSVLPPLAVRAEPPTLERLCPLSVSREGWTLRVAESLDHRLPEFEKLLLDAADETERQAVDRRRLIDDAEAIARRLHGIIGLEEDPARRAAGLVQSLRVEASPPGTPAHPVTLHLAPAEEVKEALRRGASLPGLAYDRRADRATMTFAHHTHSGDEDPQPITLVLPIAADGPGLPVQKMVGLIVGVSRQRAPLRLHAVTSEAVFERFRHSRVHGCWFVHGAATALTAFLVEEQDGPEAALAAMAFFDPSGYADLRTDCNLAYWLGAPLAIPTFGEGEERLKSARLAYAAALVRRLLDEHGVEIVAAVAEAAETEEASATGFLRAVSAATGEDAAARLAVHGPHPDRAGAIAALAARFEASRDPAAKLEAVLRLHELKGGTDPADHAVAAVLTSKVHGKEAGEAVIASFEGVLADRPDELAAFRALVETLRRQPSAARPGA